LTAIWKLCNYS